MRSLTTRLAQSVPVAALMATGFALGIYFLDFAAYTQAPASWEARNDHPAGQGDVRAVIAFLRMCRA